jgi:hypothetical protein
MQLRASDWMYGAAGGALLKAEMQSGYSLDDCGHLRNLRQAFRLVIADLPGRESFH